MTAISQQMPAAGDEPSGFDWKLLTLAGRDCLIVGVSMFVAALIFREGIGQLFALGNVEENFTLALNRFLIFALPFALFITASLRLRAMRRTNTALTIVLVAVFAVLIQSVILGGYAAAGTGPFGMVNTVQMELEDTPEGVRVVSIEPGGVAEQGGLQVGDIILQIRRDDVDKATIETAVLQSEPGDRLRFRFIRDGEEMAEPVDVAQETGVNTSSIVSNYIASIVVAMIALYLPGSWVPYGLLALFLSPLMIGYTWLIIATFSYRTEGLMPVTADGSVGGWTLSNWTFLLDGQIGQRNQVAIWTVTLNSLVIAVVMTVIVLLVASMAGYALSRMNFPGRRSFLSMTLILHGFPAITLIIPIFMILQQISSVPVLGNLFGFNTLGGVALVMVAFELPLGVWLMKGFFDGISWDMERSAMIDGASRWRTFFEIILPQIRPGLMALGVFSFLGGWNAYLIPATYMIGTRTSNLPVLINNLTGELQPTNWNQVAAVGLFQLIPILIFFIFAQEFLLNIYAGGSKGSS